MPESCQESQESLDEGDVRRARLGALARHLGRRHNAESRWSHGENCRES